MLCSSEVEGHSVAGGEAAIPLWRGAFISSYGNSVVILLDLLMVTYSLSKDCWSVTTEIFSFTLQCVCTQDRACWQRKGDCNLV